jgi:hypothetical protein
MRWVRLLFEVVLIVALIVSVFAVQQGSTRGHSLFLPHFIFAATAASISVQGTWRLDDGDDAYLNQTTTIECERSTMRCIEASAVLLRDDLMQAVSINRLKVLRWDDDLIVTEGVGARCINATYEFRPAVKSVIGVQTRRDDTPCNTPDAKSVTRLHMIDGYEESWAKRLR